MKITDPFAGLDLQINSSTAKLKTLNEDARTAAAAMSILTGEVSVMVQALRKVEQATTVIRGLNGVVNMSATATKIAQEAIVKYTAKVAVARAAISVTTGATKALNIAMAASPYMLAVAGVAALVGGLYTWIKSTEEADEKKKRLNSTMEDMNSEVVKEQNSLNDLFTPLLNATEATDEWHGAKAKIEEQYGDYLKQLNIEITDVESAKVAYDKLSLSILDVARSRAKEQAMSNATQNFMEKETGSLKKMRKELVKKFGEEKGSKYFIELSLHARTGEALSKEAAEAIKSFDKVKFMYMGMFAPAKTYTDNSMNSLMKALQNHSKEFEKEIEEIEQLFTTSGNGLELPVIDNKNDEGPSGEVTRVIRQIVKTEVAVDPDSIAAFEKKLSELKKEQKNAPFEVAVTLTPQIKELEEQLQARKFMVDIGGERTMERLDGGPVRDTVLSSGMSGMEKLQKGGEWENLQLDPIEIPVEVDMSGMERWKETVDEMKTQHADLIGIMGGVGSTMSSLGQIVGGNAGQWLDWGASLIGAVATALPEILALATANTAAAATGAASSVSSIPFVGPVLAVAAVASVLAALSGLPKFAKGGIAYGPTLGIFGEYSGAQNNPEVVAPLNTLRNLIQPVGAASGDVRFHIEGRNLVGIMQKMNHVSNRTR